MSRNPILDVVLPPAPASADLINSCHSLPPLAETIQIISVRPLPEIVSGLSVNILGEKSFSGMAQLINDALKLARGEFITVLAPGVQLSPKLTAFLTEYGEEHAHSEYFYGDYEQVMASGERQLVPSNSCPDDITEREDWGPFEIYRISGLQRLGGCDERRRFRPDYDLQRERRKR